MFIALFTVSVLGLSLGSFVNLCVFRIPRGLSILRPASFCPSCRRSLRWRELVPVLSFVVSGGRCRSCSAVISLRYPYTELLVAAIAVVFYLVEGASARYLYNLTFVILMALIAFIDWQHLIIPNAIVAVGVVLGLVLILTFHPTAAFSHFVSSIGGFCAALSILLLGSWLFKKPVMGFGDVKLSGLIALFLGFEDYLVSLWLAAVLGSILGVTLKLVHSWKNMTELDAHPARREGFPIRYVSRNISPIMDKGAIRDRWEGKGEILRNLLPELKLPFGSFLSLTSSIVLVFSETIDHLLSSWLTWMQ